MLDATEAPGTVSLLKVTGGRALTCAYLGREYTVELDLDFGSPYFNSRIAFESLAHPAPEAAVALIDLLDAIWDEDGYRFQAAIDDLDDDDRRGWTGRAHVLSLAPICEAA